jgi:hypothetical protein
VITNLSAPKPACALSLKITYSGTGKLHGNRFLSAPIMLVRDLRAFAFGLLSGQPNPLVAFITTTRRAIVNFFLFVLEIFLVVAGIALVPARSELRVSRTRVVHNEREQGNSLRS